MFLGGWFLHLGDFKRNTASFVLVELRKIAGDFGNVVVFITEFADGDSDDDDGGVEGGGEGSQ